MLVRQCSRPRVARLNMLATFLIVLPIFGLILAGWLARRLNILGPNATSELNQFVVYLALPALLFDIVVHAQWAELWQPGFIGAFGSSIAALFLTTLLWRLGCGALVRNPLLLAPVVAGLLRVRRSGS